MTDPLALTALLGRSPKTHHQAIRRAFEIGKRTAQISHQNNLREILGGLFEAADMDVENEPRTDD